MKDEHMNKQAAQSIKQIMQSVQVDLNDKLHEVKDALRKIRGQMGKLRTKIKRTEPDLSKYEIQDKVEQVGDAYEDVLYDLKSDLRRMIMGLNKKLRSPSEFENMSLEDAKDLVEDIQYLQQKEIPHPEDIYAGLKTASPLATEEKLVSDIAGYGLMGEKTEQDVLDALKRMKHPRTKRKLIQYYRHFEPRVAAIVAEFLSEDPDEYIRERLASYSADPDFSWKASIRLSQDDSSKVRAQIAMHEQDEHVLKELARDEDPVVLEALSKNPKLQEDVRKWLEYQEFRAPVPEVLLDKMF